MGQEEKKLFVYLYWHELIASWVVRLNWLRDRLASGGDEALIAAINGACFSAVILKGSQSLWVSQ